MSFDLTNKNISDTFQNLLQKTGSDNRLYDLEGNEVTNLRINGTLTADQYVVSSSVTNVTTLTQSGSSQFGDSADDTHIFTGNVAISGANASSVVSHSVDGLTVAGDISASGHLYVDGHTKLGTNSRILLNRAGTHADDYITYDSAQDAIHMQSDFIHLAPVYGVGIGSDTSINRGMVGLTVAGDISASGTIESTGNITSEGTTLTLQNVSSPKVVIKDTSNNFALELEQTNQTANIRFDDSANQNLKFDSNATDNHMVLDGGTGFVGIGKQNPSHKLTVFGDISASGELKVESHITASGNISGSSTSTLSIGDSFIIGDLANGAYVSASQGNLELSGSGTGLLQVEGDISSSGATIYAKTTIANDDATPTVANGTYFETGTNTDVITTFDNGSTGQIIHVISKAAITYDVTSTTLKCGTTDLVTAANDLTSWLFDGTNWICLGFTDQSDDLS